MLFETEQIKVLKDKKGKIIDGDQNNSILVEIFGHSKKFNQI